MLAAIQTHDPHPEILVPYGETVFASKAGPVRGNPVMTIVEVEGQVGELGRRVPWKGAQPIHLAAFARASDPA